MKGHQSSKVIMDEASKLTSNFKPDVKAQYGIQFHDGSVSHPFNGRTELMRIRNMLEYLEECYPSDKFVIVTREDRDKPWRVFE